MNNFKDEIKDIIQIESKKYDLNICGGWVEFRSSVASKILQLLEFNCSECDLYREMKQLESEPQKLKSGQVVIGEGKAFVEKFMGFSNYKFGIGKLWHDESLSYELRKALQRYKGKQVKLILQIKDRV